MKMTLLVSRLMAYAIASVEPGIAEDEQIDYPALFSFSKAHSVANIVCYALERLGRLPAEYAPAFKKEQRLAIVREATQEVETKEVADELRRRSIRFMLLKGSVMKQLYPSPDMRSMCDVDIQYDTSRADEIDEIMLSRGYEKTEVGGTGGVNISYKKPPFMNIEFHGVLMDKDIPLYNDYFGTDFERTVEAEGSERKYRDEDFFVFMAAHTAKHYFHGGTGLRSVADIWLYFRMKPQLNREYIFAELKKIKLDEFIKTILGVAGALFDGDEPGGGQNDIIKYIADSGTHGTLRHIAAQGVGEKSKARYLLSRLFPPRSFMAINYPTVERLAFLLPLFWLVRLIKIALKRQIASKDVSMVLTMPQSSFDARKIEGNPFVE